MRPTHSEKGHKKQPHVRVEAATRRGGEAICTAGQPEQRAARGRELQRDGDVVASSPGTHGKRLLGFRAEGAAPGQQPGKEGAVQTDTGGWVSGQVSPHLWAQRYTG